MTRVKKSQWLGALAVGLLGTSVQAVPVTTGLLYHLDAGQGITLNGSNVSQWNDQSGNGRDFAQAGVTKQPLYVASNAAFNNLATIRFDGNESGANGNPIVRPNTDALLMSQSVTARTVFIVNSTSRHENIDGIWGINNADKGIRRESATNWSHPGNGDDFSNGGSFLVNNVNTDAASLNTPHILAASKPAGLVMPTTNIGDYFQVGANAARSWQGDVAEVVVYDRVLTARETHQVNGSLGLKYGINVKPGFVISGPLGNDLTDPEQNGNDALPYNPGAGQFAGFNAEFRSSVQSGFSGESAFNAFDNKIGATVNKWCCTGPGTDRASITLDARLVETNPHFLTHFTLTSSNDTPGRDPLNFAIQGSNDGVNFETIFEYDNEFGNLFTARNQTLLFEAGVDFEFVNTAFQWFRYEVTGTGINNVHAIAEIEYFGFAIPEPMTAALSMMMLGALGIRTGRRSRLA